MLHYFYIIRIQEPETLMGLNADKLTLRIDTIVTLRIDSIRSLLTRVSLPQHSNTLRRSYSYISICLYVCVSVYKYMYIDMRVYIDVYIYMCVYIHIYIHIYIYIQVYVFSY